MKLKKGDTVVIISGKDRGKKSKVLQVFPKESRILVEGVNLRKKHQKPKKQGEIGQVVEMPGLISSSNAKLVCLKCGKTTRGGYKITEKRKSRVCKKCGQEI
ncbi:MAG: 50S ribosomal protein L24 [bacterium]